MPPSRKAVAKFIASQPPCKINNIIERVTTRTCSSFGNDQFLVLNDMSRKGYVRPHNRPDVSLCAHVFSNGFGRPP